VIGLLDPVARVCDPEGEVTVIGHEHEALRVNVKTAHGIRDRFCGDK
jgi:hypothetical protein